MQPLDPSDGAEGKCEAIAAGPAAVGLAGEDGRGGGAGGLQEAGRGGGEAEVGLGEVKLAGVLVAAVAVSVALGRVGGRDGEFGGDLVERVLGGGQAELALEQRGLGGVSVGFGEVEALGRVEQLLCLLHEAGEV